MGERFLAAVRRRLVPRRWLAARRRLRSGAPAGLTGWLCYPIAALILVVMIVMTAYSGAATCTGATPPGAGREQRPAPRPLIRPLAARGGSSVSGSAALQASADPRASASPIATSADPARCLTGRRRRRRDRDDRYRCADLRSSCSRWRASSCAMYACMVLSSRGVLIRVELAARGGRAATRAPAAVMTGLIPRWPAGLGAGSGGRAGAGRRGRWAPAAASRVRPWLWCWPPAALR